MIKCYGLHWHVDRVFWGRPHVPGSLKGSKLNNQRLVIDFREQIGIYALYADYDLVYIGQTGAGRQRLFHRLRHHRKDHLAERWNRFSWFGILGVDEENGELVRWEDAPTEKLDLQDGLNILEAVVISIAEPKLNLQRGNWAGAAQYLQVQADRNQDENGDEEE